MVNSKKKLLIKNNIICVKNYKISLLVLFSRYLRKKSIFLKKLIKHEKMISKCLLEDNLTKLYFVLFYHINQPFHSNQPHIMS